MDRISALHLIAVHDVDLGRHLFPEPRQFADVVLRVAVGIEHEIFRRCREAAPERASVAAVLFVEDELEFRVLLLELAEKLAAAVG